MLFPLLTTTGSKSLRLLLLQKILSDLRNSNNKSTNHRLNRTVQAELEELVKADRASSKALWAVKITRELWKRQIWTDSKPVEIMRECCLSENPKVVVGGVRFFLGGDKEREELQDESSDDEAVDIGRVKHQIGINKKSKKSTRAMQTAVSKVKRQQRKKNKPDPLNFSAFHLLYNSQQFAEDLFFKHLQNTKTKLALEQRLQVLQLVTRLVGLHELTVLPLYSWFLKYLIPRQQSVTSFLASLAQATHRLVPPDVLEPLVQKIANEFVSEASAGEVASAGLNAIREICRRQPEAMNDTLLQDLVQYRKSKDKGVMMAARGLLSLYREVNAELLKRKDRGKESTMAMKSGGREKLRFGEVKPGEISGLELLASAQAGDAIDEDDSKAWEIESDDSDGDSWIAVSSDDNVHPDAVRGEDAEEVDEGDESGEDVEDELLGEEDRLDGGSEDNQSEDITSPPSKKAKVTAEDGDKENSIVPEPDVGKTWMDLASTRILTPADWARLDELSLKQSINNALPASKRKKATIQKQSYHTDDPLTHEDIEAVAKLSKKLSKEEKVAHAKEGKGERNDHKSSKAMRQARKNEEGKSSTNKEKARKKNFLMTLGKAKAKNKRSLVEKGRILKAHVDRKKRGGRKGNKS